MIRVLIVIARLNIGGTSKFIQILYENLPKDTYELIIVTGIVQEHEKEIEIPENMKIIRILKLGRRINLINDILSIFKLRQIIRQTRPNIIYSHTFKAGLISRIANSKIPLIHAYHGHLFHDPSFSKFKLLIITFIERMLASRTSLIVTIGEKVGDEIRERGIGLDKEFINIPPGISPQKIPTRDDALKRLNLSNHKLNISWIARLAPVKSPERFVELSSYFPHVRFLMAGDGFLSKKIFVSKTDNLEILGWQNSKDIWAVSDVVVSTSFNEGMPISLIEAQLAGVPVVALDVGSVSEVVRNGETGYVLSTFGPNFIHALDELIRDKQKLADMGRLAKLYATQNFGLDTFIKRHLDLFAAAIENNTKKK